MNAVILESESNQDLELVLDLAKKLGVKSREVPAQHQVLVFDNSVQISRVNSVELPIIEALTSPLLVDSIRLVLDYVQVLRKIGYDNYALANQVFTKIIQTLLAHGVSAKKISVGSTEDDSLSVRGKVGDKSFYFETYFDDTEYEDGYEVIANVYQDKKNLASIAGSMDFVFQRLDKKLGVLLLA